MTKSVCVCMWGGGTNPVAPPLLKVLGHVRSLVRFPVEAHNFVLTVSLIFRGLKLVEDHTNEIKHDIHPEKWVQRDMFNIN